MDTKIHAVSIYDSFVICKFLHKSLCINAAPPEFRRKKAQLCPAEKQQLSRRRGFGNSAGTG